MVLKGLRPRENKRGREEITGRAMEFGWLGYSRRCGQDHVGLMNFFSLPWEADRHRFKGQVQLLASGLLLGGGVTRSLSRSLWGTHSFLFADSARSYL